jgi:hypothetical protein
MKTLALIVLVSAAFAQEHAPTPEQCRADYRLWTANGFSFENVSWKELMQRSGVMTKCATTDPDMMRVFDEGYVRLGKDAPLSYRDVGTLFHSAAGDKAMDFLIRHNLMDQFVREDAAGKK